MSRLYGYLKGDRSMTKATRTGNERIEAEIYWGDRWSPKLAVKVVVEWKFGEEKPTVGVFLGDEGGG